MAPLSDSQWTRRLIPPLHIFLILNLTLTIHLATAEEEPITTTPTNNTTSESNDKVPIVIHSEEDEEGDIEDDYSDPSLWGCRCWSRCCLSLWRGRGSKREGGGERGRSWRGVEAGGGG